jgi:glycerol uptake facilitator-like aquaporin
VLLVATVVGSGIMATNLSRDVAVHLLGKTLRTGAILVGLTTTTAYRFTASTSFANPAVTLARGFTTSFSGIALKDCRYSWLCNALGLSRG